MSGCRKSVAALLEADVDELLGYADTELSRHLSGCARCAAAAQRILDANRALDHALDSAPALDVETVLARARLAAAAGAAGRSARRPDARHATGSPGRRWHAWAGLVAAASVAALVLLSDREPSLPGTPTSSLATARATVEAPADRNVIVIQTDNPDITVLWFF